MKSKTKLVENLKPGDIVWNQHYDRPPDLFTVIIVNRNVPVDMVGVKFLDMSHVYPVGMHVNVFLDQDANVVGE